MSAPTFDDIVDALSSDGRVVSSRGGHVMARCPLDGHSNGDRNPGLSLTDGDMPLVFCHGQHGACYSDILAHYGIDAGSGSNKVKRGRHELLDLYDYTDLNGEVLYQVARLFDTETNSKTFRQRRPDGDGGWVNNLDGVKRVPFNLIGITEAITSGKPVVMVEGEKDVNTLLANNIEATTTAQGAKSWGAGDYGKWFAGATVVIVPDKDEQGEFYALQVARDLRRVAGKVMIARLPDDVGEKGDSTDFIAMHGAKAYVELLNGASEYTPDMDRIDPDLTASSAIAKAAVVTASDDEVSTYWPDEGLEISLSDFAYAGTKIEAVLNVSLGINGRIIIDNEVRLQSATARDRIVTTINRYGQKKSSMGREWNPYIEFAFGTAISYLKSPAEWTDLASLPIDDLMGEEWVLPPIFQGGRSEEGATVIVAHGGTGKSYIALGIHISIASGKPVFGDWQPEMVGKVLFLDWESSARKHRRRLERIAFGARIDLDDIKGNLLYSRERTPLVNSILKIRSRVRKEGIQAIVIDSLRGAAKGSLKDDDTAEMFFNAVNSLGVPVLIIHHLNRADDYFGSAFIRNFARFMWVIDSAEYLNKDPIAKTGKKAILMRCDKDNEGGMEGDEIGMVIEWANPEIYMTPHSGAWTQARIKAADKGGNVGLQAIDVITDEKRWMTAREVTETIEPDKSKRESVQRSVGRALRGAHERGEILRHGSGQKLTYGDKSLATDLPLDEWST